MIIEYIRFKLKSALSLEGRLATVDFESAWRGAATALADCRHCLRYELSHCREEPDRYILRFEWDSLEGHLSGFRQSENFPSFREAIKPFVGSIEEMLHYELTSTVSTRCEPAPSGERPRGADSAPRA